MSLKINKYLIDIRRQANEFERTDINGNVDSSFKRKNTRRIIFSFISILLVLNLNEGINNSFISYFANVLSILVGLFITILIFSFDKFYNKTQHKFKSIELGLKNEDNKLKEKLYKIWYKDVYENNSIENLSDKQTYFFSKQFIFITGYNIVLCIFTIILLSITTLFENPKVVNPLDVNLHTYIFNFENITINSIILFIKLTFIAIHRFLVLYWLFKIMYNSLFIVSSMVKYMIVQIDRNYDPN